METNSDNGKRKRGRPALGNVLFARRVHPSKVPEILELLKKDKFGGGSELRVKFEADGGQWDQSVPYALEKKPDAVVATELANVKALLDDVEKKDLEIEHLKGQLDEAMMLDLDEKGRMGWKLYFDLKNSVKKAEFDQT